MAQITTAGIDPAKTVFALRGVDGFGKVQLRKDSLEAGVGIEPAYTALQAAA